MLKINDNNYKWWITATMGLIIFILCVDWTIVNLAIPTIAMNLHSTLSQIQWILNAYALTIAMFMILGGKLADHYGKRVVLIIGVFIFTLSVGIAGLAHTEWVLISCRAVQGIGASFSLPLATLFIFKAFPENRRGFAIGIVGSIAGFSLALGPTLGGFILHWLSWRWVFFVNVPVGIVGMLLSFYVCRKDELLHEDKRIDYIGVIILSAGLLGLTLALNEVNNWGLSSLFWFCLLGGIFCLSVFPVLEKYIPSPLIDVDVFKNKCFLSTNFIRMMIQYEFGAFGLVVILYLQNILGYSPMKSGMLLLFTTVILGLTSPFSGRLVDIFGGNKLIIIGAFIIGVANILFACLGISPSLLALGLPLFFFGAGVSLTMPGTTNLALSSVSEKQSNVATGIFYTIGFLGGIVGIAVSGIMLSVFSMRWLQAEIVKQGIQMSKSNWQILLNAANGSYPVNRLPNYFPNKLAEKLVPIVQHSFLHAYAAIMLLCAFFMLLSLLMTVLIKP